MERKKSIKVKVHDNNYFQRVVYLLSELSESCSFAVAVFSLLS